MPELRKDPIVGRWVIIATERARRPMPQSAEPLLAPGGYCPFCEGNEDKTPNEIYSFRELGTHADQPGWRVRVVPNKFPALQIEGDLQKKGDGIYDCMNGIGAHEVILECPFHETSMARLPESYIREILWTYHERLADLKMDSRMVYGMIFKNVGAAAGASLEHSHSQLIVTPILPVNVLEEMNGALEFYKYRGRCIYCDIISQELGADKRVIFDSPSFLVIAPYASRFPFETWIIPTQHNSHYENASKSELDELAGVLKTILLKLEIALDNPAYNYMIHTGALNTSQLPHYHWHIEIIPRLTRVAGFEWGTGFYINHVPPEQAALVLRNTEVDTL